MKRESGYYWVKFHVDKSWQIAYYSRRLGWHAMGVSGAVHEPEQASDFKITEPKE